MKIIFECNSFRSVTIDIEKTNQKQKNSILNTIPFELIVPGWNEAKSSQQKAAKLLSKNFKYTAIELELGESISKIKKIINEKKIPGIIIIKSGKKRILDYMIGITTLDKNIFMIDHRELNNIYEKMKLYSRAIVFGEKKPILKQRLNFEPVEHLGKLYPVNKEKIKERFMKEYQSLYFPYNSLDEARAHAKKRGYRGLIVSGLDNDFDVILKEKISSPDDDYMVSRAVSIYFLEMKRDKAAANRILKEKEEQLNDLSFEDNFIELEEDLIDLNRSIKENEENIIMERPIRNKTQFLEEKNFEKLPVQNEQKKSMNSVHTIHKVIPKPIETQRIVQTYKRNRTIVEEVLENANYKCEFQPSHETFTSGSTGNMYMEVHHLIPMQYQNNFKWNLDIPENMVSLCPTCHRMIHHGTRADIKKIVTKLYKKRKNIIDVDLDEILNLYYK